MRSRPGGRTTTPARSQQESRRGAGTEPARKSSASPGWSTPRTCGRCSSTTWIRGIRTSATRAGNQAGLDYLQKHAGYSRVGHHGGAAGRFIDAHKWTIASFFQHDSRNHDPQLHIHNTASNRVMCADGEWRTLDSKGIHKI